MNEFVMSLPAKNQYYCDKIDVESYNIVFTKKNYNKFSNFLRKVNLFFVKRIKVFPFLKQINKKICYKIYDKKIVDAIVKDTGLAIIDAYVNDDLLYLMKKYRPKKSWLLIWNPLTDEKANYYKKYLPIDNIYSYSIDESKKYGFHHFNDFYYIDYPKLDLPIKRDFYFLGHDKNRMELLEKFAKLIGDKYTFQFDIFTAYLDESKKGNKLFNYFSEYIPFIEYLNRVFESKCLVDFNNTTNITFRTLESLIFEKKYITNNKGFMNMDFYNPNNILIVDANTTMNDIDEFLNKPYVRIDRNILENYSVYKIYNDFKKKCEVIK